MRRQTRRQIRPAENFGTIQGLDSSRLNMSQLARGVYGDLAERENSSQIALVYFLRRFGPPRPSEDDYKRLCCWILTTRDRDVFIGLHPTASVVWVDLEYYVSEELRATSMAPQVEWQAEAARRFFEMYPGASETDYDAARCESETDDWPWVTEGGDE